VRGSRETTHAGRGGRPARATAASAPRASPWERRTSASGSDSPEEARPFARVARGPHLVDAHEQRVAVAVEPDVLHVLHVAGRLALAPQLLPRPAPEYGPPLLERARKRIRVHPGHHEHVAVLRILHHRGDETPVVEPNLRDAHRLHHVNLMGIPRSASDRFTSPIESSSKWKREAASTASACPSSSASAKCSIAPAPPLAITGTGTASDTARVSSMS